MSRSVLLVLHEAALGGATTAVLRPLDALRRDGLEVAAWAPPGPVAAALVGQGVLVAGEERPLAYSPAALRRPPGPAARLAATPGYLRRFRRFVEAVGPDVVHANTLLTLPEALTARTAGVATLLHVHEMVGDGPRGRAAARLARGCDRTVAVSEASAAALRRHGGPAGVITAGIAVDDPGAVLRRPGPLRVGTLGTVSHRKGTDVFVAAARALRASGRDVELHLAGPPAGGPDAAWAERQLADARAAGIVCHGAVEGRAALRGWDVFVLPTRRDPFPLVVLEAMAAGVPVVASAVDGVVEQVGDEAGVLVAPGDPGALAAAVATLLDDPKRRAEAGRAGRRRITALFTPERNARELDEAYESALAARESPRRARCVA